MASSPKYKVYTAGGEYVASCKFLEDCAALVAMRGDGTTVRIGHSTIIWREGEEEIPAGESYDRAAQIMAWHEQDRYAQAEVKAQQHRKCAP